MITLTKEQEAAFDDMASGRHNVALFGGGGSGKSATVNAYLAGSGGGDGGAIAVVASTARAAVLVDGCTLHSFFGLGVHNGQTVIRASKKSMARLRRVSHVIVDEVSMCGASVLDMAERCAQEARGSHAPWGGLQMTFVGDAAQLPCINDNWFFQSAAWQSAAPAVHTLSFNHRSGGDNKLLAALDVMRTGAVTPELAAFLESRVQLEVPIGTPRLLPRNIEVDAFNQARLRDLPGGLWHLTPQCSGSQHLLQKMLPALPMPMGETWIKAGALVCVRKNEPEMEWWNGCLGHVEAAGKADGELVVRIRTLESPGRPSRIIHVPRVKWELSDGDESARVWAHPITLAWATTIHGAQGATLDRVHTDLRDLWSHGQAYVAVSRVRRSEDLTLAGWEACSIMTDSRVRAFMRETPPPARLRPVSAAMTWQWTALWDDGRGMWSARTHRPTPVATTSAATWGELEQNVKRLSKGAYELTED